MGPSTPRRPQKQRNHPGAGAGGRRIDYALGAPAPVDYESDALYPEAAAYPQPAIPPQPVAAQSQGQVQNQNQREHTIDEINLTVLKRYVPTILDYTAMAHNATLFTWNMDSGGWEETGVKGPFFVCNQEQQLSATGRPVPRACAFILNRSSPENAVFDLATIAECEFLQGQLLSTRTDAGQGWGFFMDMGKAQETWDAFRKLWHNVRPAANG